MTVVLFLAIFVVSFVSLTGELTELTGRADWWKAAAAPAVATVTGFGVGTAAFLSPLAGIFLAILAWRVTRFITADAHGRRRSLVGKQVRDLVAAAAGMFGAGKTAAEVLEAAAGHIGDPLAADLAVCVARSRGAREPLPRLLLDLAACWDLPELRAMADIARFGEDTGGRRAVSRGLVRLGDALRRRDRLLAERAKGVAEPALAAWVALAILSGGVVTDATALRSLFAVSLAGRVDLALGLGVIVTLVFMVLRLLERFREV